MKITSKEPLNVNIYLEKILETNAIRCHTFFL